MSNADVRAIDPDERGSRSFVAVCETCGWRSDPRPAQGGGFTATWGEAHEHNDEHRRAHDRCPEGRRL